jgi:N-acetyltransferase
MTNPSKLTTLLDTINITLSAPALTPETLRISKAYLFLLSPESSSSSGTHKEKIIGCVIAQRITTAMAIAPHTPATDTLEESKSRNTGSLKDSTVPSASESSESSSIALIPTPLPTPLGVSRLFVSSSHRRLGIGSRLLTETASTFIHGCPLDPKKGDVAFSQPTGLGGKVLAKWAGGNGRVFEET